LFADDAPSSVAEAEEPRLCLFGHLFVEDASSAEAETEEPRLRLACGLRLLQTESSVSAEDLTLGVVGWLKLNSFGTVTLTDLRQVV
jgi:hypothetical protein